MKIAMFTNTYLPHVGGVANSVARFTEDLRDLGHEVLILAPSFPESDESDAAEPDIVRVPAIQRFNGSDFSMRIRLPFVIDEAIDRFAPKVIHSHHPYLIGDAAVRAARRRGLPLIFTHHTRYEKYTHYVTPGASETMKELAANLATVYANMCDIVVAPSESFMEMIRGRGVESPVSCIPTGVDTAVFDAADGGRFRQEQGISDQAVVVGHVGRLAPEKNLGFLAESVALALETCEEAVFLVVGDGPDHKTIATAFRSRGIEDRLIAPGSLSGRSLVDAYGAMDLFAFASLSETQGMVLAEAMAAATPVVALDAPGVREVLVDGVNGWSLPEKASKAEFAEAVKAAVQKRNRRRRMQEEARRTARRFDRKAAARTLENIYRQLSLDSRYHGKNSGDGEDFAPWDALLNAIQVEWNLLSSKASALAATVNSENTADEPLHEGG